MEADQETPPEASFRVSSSWAEFLFFARVNSRWLSSAEQSNEWSARFDGRGGELWREVGILEGATQNLSGNFVEQICIDRCRNFHVSSEIAFGNGKKRTEGGTSRTNVDGRTSMSKLCSAATIGVVQAGLFPGTYCDGWHFGWLLRSIEKEGEGASFDRGGVPPTTTPPHMHKWLRMRVVAANIGRHKGRPDAKLLSLKSVKSVECRRSFGGMWSLAWKKVLFFCLRLEWWLLFQGCLLFFSLSNSKLFLSSLGRGGGGGGFMISFPATG